MFLAQNLVSLQQTPAKILTGSFQGRGEWLNELCHLLSYENKKNRRNIKKNK
jgi:hypothetical protein